MSAVINLVKGDALPDLVFALTDEVTKLPIDLSDIASVAMTIRAPGSPTVLVTLAGSVDAPAAAGHVRLLWGAGDLTTLGAGLFEGNIKLNHVSGKLQTVYKVGRINIRQ